MSFFGRCSDGLRSSNNHCASGACVLTFLFQRKGCDSTAALFFRRREAFGPGELTFAAQRTDSGFGGFPADCGGGCPGRFRGASVGDLPGAVAGERLAAFVRFWVARQSAWIGPFANRFTHTQISVY